MNGAEGRGELALLGDVRKKLRRELRKLTKERAELKTQLEALGEELKEVDVEVEATRRMLGLVEATEQQLAAQGEEELHESEAQNLPVEAGTQVRGGATSTISRSPLTKYISPTGHASDSSQSTPVTIA
jgi:septal ring factor EnvC (AmiA/AmiB activator)